MTQTLSSTGNGQRPAQRRTQTRCAPRTAWRHSTWSPLGRCRASPAVLPPPAGFFDAPDSPSPAACARRCAATAANGTAHAPRAASTADTDGSCSKRVDSSQCPRCSVVSVAPSMPGAFMRLNAAVASNRVSAVLPTSSLATPVSRALSASFFW